MVEIPHSVVVDIHASWGKLKRVDKLGDKLGDLILDRMFEIEPQTRKFFKFAEITDKECLHKNAMFAAHAHAIVDILDCVEHILGPDLEPLEQEMERIGRRHKEYGVPTKFLPLMEKSVLWAFEELLHDDFSRAERNSWHVVFHFITDKMIDAMTH